MSIEEIRIPFTTDADGDAVVYSERPVFGRLYAVCYDRGDMVTGTDLVLTTDRYDVVVGLFTKANMGTSDLYFYPRTVVHKDTDGAALTGTAGGDRVMHVLAGRLKLTVDEGGATKSGALIVIYEV
jgi:hypothetical protein